jgi:hypothetical protein
MGLNIEQITEIQLAAEYNTLKRIREAQEQKEYKETLADKIAEARTRNSAKPAKEAAEPKKG